MVFQGCGSACDDYTDKVTSATTPITATGCTEDDKTCICDKLKQMAEDCEDATATDTAIVKGWVLGQTIFYCDLPVR